MKTAWFIGANVFCTRSSASFSAGIGRVGAGPRLGRKGELWGLLVFDFCMYVSIVVLVVFRNWSYELRAAGILIVALAIEG